MNEHPKNIPQNIAFWGTVATQAVLILSVSFLILASEHIIRIGAYEISVHKSLIQHI